MATLTLGHGWKLEDGLRLLLSKHPNPSIPPVHREKVLQFPAIKGAANGKAAPVLGSFRGLSCSPCQALSPRSNDPAFAGTLLMVGAAGKDHSAFGLVA